MANSILTSREMMSSAREMLKREMQRNEVFSLCEVTLKDGTVLGPIMLEMTPYDIERVQRIIADGFAVITLANENESLLVPVADIKHIKMMRVTSKE